MIRFDPKEHKYWRTVPGGELEVPSVTRVIDESGLTNPFAKSDERAHFGTCGHETIALMIRNRLQSYDPAFEPYMIGIRKFFEDQQPAPYFGDPARGSERVVHSERFGYCGMLDFFGQIRRFKNVDCILDWKFWSSASKDLLILAGIQTSAYDSAVREYELISRPCRRAVVHFEPGRYTIHECKDSRDWNRFHAAVVTFRTRVELGRVELERRAA